jgi:hypothetical protein
MFCCRLSAVHNYPFYLFCKYSTLCFFFCLLVYLIHRFNLLNFVSVYFLCLLLIYSDGARVVVCVVVGVVSVYVILGKYFPYFRNVSVAYRGRFGGLTPPQFRSFDKAEPNFQFRGKYIHNNLIRNGFHSFANWVEPLTRGLPPPDPRSLCPLSSTNFVEPPSPRKKNS